MESKGELLSSEKLIPCPKCRHENNQDNSVSIDTVRCAACGHSFPSNAVEVRSKQKKTQIDSFDIIPVRCSQCQKKFGVKARSAGREVACPHCKTRQTATAGDTENRKKENIEFAERPLVAKQVVESPFIGAKDSGPDSKSAEVQELLPPKYLVPKSLELTTTSPLRFCQTSDIQQKQKTDFEIDTDVLRLPIGDRVAEVQPMTRENRDRRKRLRVAVVYLFGAIVLIVVFWWLMGRTDLETS